ncbi:MAG: FmdB family zinc ribbon protein [Anaerolineae bacterium]
MPLYEYKCKECGLRFERRQHFSDPPVDTCPECQGEVVRLIQPAGIIFKGSGFYVTDNRTKSSTATPGTRSDASETTSDNDSTPSEKSTESSSS